MGIGGSVQTGLKYAFTGGCDYAVQVDGDGQHNPKFIPGLLKIADNGYDLVIGSRFIKKSHYQGTLFRNLGNNIFSWLIQWTCNQKIYDSTSGFRVFNRKAMAFLIHHYPIDFPEPESIVKLFKNGFKIKEVAVEMKQRQAGESSVSRIKAIYLMLSISLAILIEAIKKPVKYAN